MNKLKYYRKINKLTQKEIADYLKITQPNYANIENQKTKINIDYALMLSKLYKTNLTELIEDDTELINIKKEDFKILLEAKEIIEKIQKKYKL